MTFSFLFSLSLSLLLLLSFSFCASRPVDVEMGQGTRWATDRKSQRRRRVHMHMHMYCMCPWCQRVEERMGVRVLALFCDASFQRPSTCRSVRVGTPWHILGGSSNVAMVCWRTTFCQTRPCRFFSLFHFISLFLLNIDITIYFILQQANHGRFIFQHRV